MPRNRSGYERHRASFSIGLVDVFVARIVSGPITLSSSPSTACLMSLRSTTLSIMSCDPRSEESIVDDRSLPANSSARLGSAARLSRSQAASSSSGGIALESDNSETSTIETEKSCLMCEAAMPQPIIPAPTTPTLSINSGLRSARGMPGSRAFRCPR